MSAETTILTGQDAIDHMADSWQTTYHGMVHLDVVDPFFVVSRAGADYACYLSLVDGTAITVDPMIGERGEHGGIPNDRYPDEETAGEEVLSMIETAFESRSGGSYPLVDDGVFGVSYYDEESDTRKRLEIGLLDDTVRVNDDP